MHSRAQFKHMAYYIVFPGRIEPVTMVTSGPRSAFLRNATFRPDIVFNVVLTMSCVGLMVYASPGSKRWFIPSLTSSWKKLRSKPGGKLNMR